MNDLFVPVFDRELEFLEGEGVIVGGADILLSGFFVGFGFLFFGGISKCIVIAVMLLFFDGDLFFVEGLGNRGEACCLAYFVGNRHRY